MKWSSGLINKVREAHDIVDWIGQDTSLKGYPDGRFIGLCPFPDHNEKTPSFSVSSDKQVYFCFGCQKGGDIFTYFRDQKGMNFVETMEYLAQKAGIKLEKISSLKGEETYSLKRDYLNINKKIADQSYKKRMSLGEDHKINHYLKKRGYSKETIDKFQIGYGLSIQEISQILDSTQIKRAEEIGILINKGKLYSPFQNRCIFPIISTVGEVIGFGGRSLDSSIPKYLNSKDSICFQKGYVFYGLSNSAPSIRKTGYAIIVEGYTDFLSLFQNGFQNVVATLGTALTPHHGQLLKRYTTEVIMLFDGDEAGTNAALRSLPILLEAGINVKKVELNGMDPDEYLSKKGVELFKETIRNSQDLFISTFLNQIENKTGVERLNVVRSITPIFARIKDEALKEYYKRYMLDAFLPSEQESVRILLEQPQKVSYYTHTKDKKEVKKAPTQQEKIVIGTTPKIELYLMALALKKDSYLLEIEKRMQKKPILTQLNLQQLWIEIFEEYHKDPQNFDQLLAKITHKVTPESCLHTEHHTILRNLTENQGFNFINDCFDRLFLDSEGVKLKSLLQKMRVDKENQDQYLKEIQNIKKNISSLEKKYEK